MERLGWGPRPNGDRGTRTLRSRGAVFSGIPKRPSSVARRETTRSSQLELGAGGGITAQSGGEKALEGWRGGKRGSRGGPIKKAGTRSLRVSDPYWRVAVCVWGCYEAERGLCAWIPPVYWVGRLGEQRYTQESSRSDLDSESRWSHPRRQDAGVHGFGHLQTGAPSAGRILGCEACTSCPIPTPAPQSRPQLGLWHLASSHTSFLPFYPLLPPIS